MLVSLAKVMPNPGLADTGLAQQVELFNEVRMRTRRVPPVVDARDVLLDPRGVLSALCGAVGVPFTERMLSWEPGPRPTDGVWAKHWYAAVERSTGFDRYQKRDEAVPPALKEVLAECRAYYDIMHAHRLRA